jgi:4-oxalocrotonate tautomerase
MPLVRIDVMEGRTAAELASIGDGVHRALVETIGIPEADRFQVISEHGAGRLFFDTGYLGISRTSGVVLIQITISSGRSLDQKRALYEAIARNLAARPGMRTEDVFVNVLEVVRENWSFGNGVAQYAT